jgi:hypothetical protein
MSNMALPLPASQQRGTNDPRVPLTHFGVANMKRLIKAILSLAVIALGTGSASAGAITTIDFQTGSANASFFDPVGGHEGGHLHRHGHDLCPDQTLFDVDGRRVRGLGRGCGI